MARIADLEAQASQVEQRMAQERRAWGARVDWHLRFNDKMLEFIRAQAEKDCPGQLPGMRCLVCDYCQAQAVLLELEKLGLSQP